MIYWAGRADLGRTTGRDFDSLSPSYPFDGYGLDEPCPQELPEIRLVVPNLKRAADFYRISLNIIVSDRLQSCIALVGEMHFEPIPIIVVDRNGSRTNSYRILNLRRPLDCVERAPGEEGRSALEVVRPGRPFRLMEKEIPADRHFFLVGSALIISDTFRQEYEKGGLSGMKFLSPEEY
jgi:hypothetical protein